MSLKTVLFCIILSIFTSLSHGNSHGFISLNNKNSMQLVDQTGSPFLIKGVGFGNSVWSNPSSTKNFVNDLEHDYKKVKEFGFNTVRFYLNYGLFEDDKTPYKYKEEGFKWLDKNIEEAKKNGVYLLLNMHYPQGGYQPLGEGDDLWDNRQNQNRLIKLWREIAKRYRDEETVLGYGILNEPIPVSGIDQWQELAQIVINSIRSVDRKHLIFIERALWTKVEPSEEDKKNLLFPMGLKDPYNSLVYEFHFYSPFKFTHQNANWLDYFKDEFNNYPNNNEFFDISLKWEDHSKNSKNLELNRDFRSFETDFIQNSNKTYNIARPVLQVVNIKNLGSVTLKELIVDEYDISGKFIKTLIHENCNNVKQWHIWSSDGSGSVKLNKGINVVGVKSDSNISLNRDILLDENKKYKIKGIIKGKGLNSDSIIKLRLDYFSTEDKIVPWGKEGLKNEIDIYIHWAKQNNVPLYLGEFGTINDSFKENRGGIIWTEHMLELLHSNGIHYNYHTFHESSFGIYSNIIEERPTEDKLNVELVELLKKYQK